MSQTHDIIVPDIGDFENVDVIEVLVRPGDTVSAEDPLITLESDKATMDVPSPTAGVVKELKISVGDKVSEGSLVAILESAESTESDAPSSEPASPTSSSTRSDAESKPNDSQLQHETDQSDKFPQVASTPEPESGVKDERSSVPPPPASLPSDTPTPLSRLPHASPAVRRFARELGVDLTKVTGRGPRGRILIEDVRDFVKTALISPSSAPTEGSGIPAIPEVDFSKWGPVEMQALSRIKRISGKHLHRAWLNVPHVTHHDEADITELESFRQSLKDEAARSGLRVTLLAFVIKAVSRALKTYPVFNCSLAPDGEHLILKNYFHIGVAVDTPGGLVVPVVRNVDQKGVLDIVKDLADLSTRAREGKLKPDEMQGGCFSISSLGGIGGTAFTPVVNAPEVAILGLTRARMMPQWDGASFQPRLMLPLDLSYDHRVIDGAQAARFVADLVATLEDARRMLL